MNTIILVFTLICTLILFLKVWNYISRRYNNNIISKSNCENCGAILGNECIIDAVKNWEMEKQKIIKENKIGTVILRNLDFICEKCGKPNSEQEIYKRNRRKNQN